jgi:hypothetical protein
MKSCGTIAVGALGRSQSPRRQPRGAQGHTLRGLHGSPLRRPWARVVLEHRKEVPCVDGGSWSVQA